MGPRLRKAFRQLQTLSKTQFAAGEPLSADPQWREKMAALEMEIDAVEMNELMFYSSLKTGDAPGSMASIVKMRSTEVGQKVTELAVEAALVRRALHRAAQLRQQHRAGGRRLRRRRLAALLQQPQDHDLRRLLRGAEERVG
jgi:alkylation response protein AidB-like acyl-CoA dehydrogenase